VHRLDVRSVGPSRDHSRHCADALRRTVAALVFLIVSVEFNQHRVVDVRTESRFDSFQVGPIAVARELHAMAQARREIGNELLSARAK
jgi:hypothetical protein